jgi:hypothetical protein
VVRPGRLPGEGAAPRGDRLEASRNRDEAGEQDGDGRARRRESPAPPIGAAATASTSAIETASHVM